MLSSIIDYLTLETDIETKQKETGRHIPDYDNQTQAFLV